jgi:hypothetical protein
MVAFAEAFGGRENAMRPIMTSTIFALAAAAAAGSAMAASSDYYLRLGDVKGGLAANAGPGKAIAILSWSWGATTADDWDGTIKGATSTGKYGTVGGMHRDDQVDPAASAPAEKRQHGWVTVSKPLDRGAVRVKVKFPWLDCKVGAAFPDAVLQNDAGRYELQDAIITGCAPDAVSLNYAKVRVRGWNPETKED